MDGAGGELLPTGIDELDRVLGGGLVPSSVTLIAGEPGIGKSTLLLQMLAAMARQGRRTLLVSAEESPTQVRMRAMRLGLVDDGVWIAGDTDLAAIRSDVANLRPDVLVVDSVQTISDQESGLAPGAVTTVRACAQALADDAKSGGPAVVLVGHVTKDGSIAGPRVLEHLVDTVLSFEGERHHSLRLLRAVKHRFGAVGELGMWEMTGTGLQEVADGATFLLADRRPGMLGSVVFAGMDGRRPILVEIQALVSANSSPSPRRSAAGYDSGRLGQLLAVLDRWAGISLHDRDVYVSAAGGIRIDDPGADLAVAAAIASAYTQRAVPDDTVLLGEVGLGGELRQVGHSPRRLAEAGRIGFRRAVVPRGAAGAADVIDLTRGAAAADRPVTAGLRVTGASLLADALDLVLTGQAVGRPQLQVLAGRD
jgi:DNA repair protein RadA/Sms